LVINSGNANACTGDQGLQDAIAMTELAGAAIGCPADKVLVMSTGIIGQHLPMDKIAAGIADAAASLGIDSASLDAAAEGILTTDDSTKIFGRSATIAGSAVELLGIAKGAGMIGPKMATMLAVLLTDAALDADDAQAILTAANDVSFNCLSVDGHMSTNDSCVMLASGLAHGSPLKGKDLAEFADLVTQVCIDLAREIANDGEGATHLIEIHVTGCASSEDAQQIAKTIANSPLVKTACAGADPNWGRIVSAAGYAGPSFDPADVTLTINGSILYQQGVPVRFDAQAVSKSMRENRETKIVLNVGQGKQSARFWTSDLTMEYIRINAEYHT
jgi:glutamate N-acetyltransferase/amino-acid N-acetyltransferase